MIGLFPSDHVIANEKEFRRIIKRAVEIAAAGENMVVMGIQPNRAETGYGYIEAGGVHGLRKRRAGDARRPALHRKARHRHGAALRCRRELLLEQRHVRLGRAHAGECVAASICRTPRRFSKKSRRRTAREKFDTVFARLYPKCENISVDYAVLEPRSAKGEGKSHLYCIPSNFGWNDLGSWAALFEHRSAKQKDGNNVIHAIDSFVLNASGNYVHSPKKFVATVGVSDLVIVETEDALLITTREKCQDVGKVVKHLDEKKLKKLT